MANPIYPGAVWYPGINAGYNAGHNAMTAVVCHYTVGRNSLDLLAREGTCQFLVARDGSVYQLAEVDAECWHAGSPFNQAGPGIEVEYLDEPTMFTDPQRDACGDLVVWLSWEWGVPLVYYDTGGDDTLRTDAHHGFLSHRACYQYSGDWHYDYWTYDDWTQMVGPQPPTRNLQVVYYGKGKLDVGNFKVFRVGEHWDSFRCDEDGTVVHSFYPWQRGENDLAVGNEIVGRDCAPDGNLDVIVRPTEVGGVGRTDVYVDDGHGALKHFFQNGPVDWAWHEDPIRW